MSNFEHRDNNRRNNFHENSDRTQLFIAKGKNDGMDENSLVEFVISQTQTNKKDITNVKVLDAFSFFAVPNEDAGPILDHFQAIAGEGRPLVSKAKRKKSNNDRFSGGGDFRRNDSRPRRSFDDRPRRSFDDRPRRNFNS